MLEQTSYKTSWETAPHGDKGNVLTFRVKGNPGVIKSGQTVLVYESHQFHPSAYIHRHKLYVTPQVWVEMVMIKWSRMVEAIMPML